MRKKSLTYDHELFERVKSVLGTVGLDETVQRAFEEVLLAHARRQAVQQLQDLDGLDLAQARVMTEAWR